MDANTMFQGLFFFTLELHKRRGTEMPGSPQFDPTSLSAMEYCASSTLSARLGYTPSLPSGSQFFMDFGAGYLDDPSTSMAVKQVLSGGIELSKSLSPELRSLVVDFDNGRVNDDYSWPELAKLQSVFLVVDEYFNQFEKLYISVPEKVDVARSISAAANNNNNGDPPFDDNISLQKADKVKELFWKGDFSVLIMRFRNIQGDGLRHVHLTNCQVSLNDVICLLLCFRNLIEFELDKLENGKDIKRLMAVENRPISRIHSLSKLEITCADNPVPLLKYFAWPKLESLTLHLTVDGSNAFYKNQYRFAKSHLEVTVVPILPQRTQRGHHT